MRQRGGRERASVRGAREDDVGELRQERLEHRGRVLVVQDRHDADQPAPAHHLGQRLGHCGRTGRVVGAVVDHHRAL